jgi:hypothetical protein
MEEYLENHQAPLDPTQRKRIIHMNKDMRDQLNRIKQAWDDHNDVDRFDDIYIAEITRIITDSEDDVRETIMESRKLMNMPNVSPNSATRGADEASETGGGQKSEICSDNDGNEDNVTEAEATKYQNIRMRKVDTESRPIDDGRQTEVPARTKSKEKATLESVRASVEMLIAAQDEHNQNRRELTEEKKYNRDEPGAHVGAKQSARNKNAYDTAKQRKETRDAGESAAGEKKEEIKPAEVNARKYEGEKLINPEERDAEHGKNTAGQIYTTSAMNEIIRDGRGFHETFRKWAETKRHDDDRSARQGLKGDLDEWKRRWMQFWQTHKRAFILRPDYGVIKLQYDMAQQNLRTALNKIDTRDEENDCARTVPDGKKPAVASTKQDDQQPTEDTSEPTTSHWCRFTDTWPNLMTCITCGKEPPPLYDSYTDSPRDTDEARTGDPSADESVASIITSIEGNEATTTRPRTPKRESRRRRKHSAPYSSNTSSDDTDSENTDSQEGSYTRSQSRRRNITSTTTSEGGGESLDGNKTEAYSKDDSEYDSAGTENEDYKLIINRGREAVKLPYGVGQVYIKGNNEELTRIKFPQADRNQYWQAIRIGAAPKTIKIHPKSNFTLDRNRLLKQVDSFIDEDDAVYRPVIAPGEVDIFGIYLSPLVRTHVFVGPFTRNKRRKRKHPQSEDTESSQSCELTNNSTLLRPKRYMMTRKTCKEKESMSCDTDSTGEYQPEIEPDEQPPQPQRTNGPAPPEDTGDDKTEDAVIRRVTATTGKRKAGTKQRPGPNRPPEKTESPRRGEEPEHSQIASTQQNLADAAAGRDEFRKTFLAMNLARPTQDHYATRSSCTRKIIAHQCRVCQVAFKLKARLRNTRANTTPIEQIRSTHQDTVATIQNRCNTMILF